MNSRTIAILLAASLTACVPPGQEEVGHLDQPGGFTQGGFTQGGFTQGGFTQGSALAINKFRYSGWTNTGMLLKNTNQVNGYLVAAWYKTPNCSSNDTSIARSCNWFGAGWGTCTWGSTVSVYAGGCGKGSSGSSDGMLRVCSGNRPCEHAAAIAYADDTKATKACKASLQPWVSFTCPKSGQYFVMVASKTPTTGDLSYSVVSSPSQTLQRWLTGAGISGTIVPGITTNGSTINVKITAATDGANSTTYHTAYQERIGAPGDFSVPLCEGTDNRAIPFYGEWINTAHWKNTSSYWTFGCMIGVLAKCYQLGYRPWDPSTGGRNYHQTCTRGGRNDICGAGGSWTITGTLIDMYDRVPYIARDPNDGFSIEAIWVREDVLNPGQELVDNKRPRCVAKKRWETIDYDAQCVSGIDPRVYSGDDVNQPELCENRTVEAWFSVSPDHLIATESSNIDAGLWRWKRSDGLEYRTTTELSTFQAAAGYVYAPKTLREPVFVGAVYHRDSPTSVRPNTIALKRYRNPFNGDYATTTDEFPPSPSTNYLYEGIEGYIKDRSCESNIYTCGPKTLQLYRKIDGTDHLTYAVNTCYTGSCLGTAPPSGYTLVGTLGYLPR